MITAKLVREFWHSSILYPMPSNAALNILCQFKFIWQFCNIKNMNQLPRMLQTKHLYWVARFLQLKLCQAVHYGFYLAGLSAVLEDTDPFTSVKIMPFSSLAIQMHSLECIVWLLASSFKSLQRSQVRCLPSSGMGMDPPIDGSNADRCWELACIFGKCYSGMPW